MKTLVLYVFHQYNERVDHFIKHAVFKDENVDFIFISNGDPIQIPGIHMIYRENIGYDFGGWSDALLTNDLYKNYDHFIFINSSVMGPYVPSYCKKWTDIYIQGLQDVKLFGSTINAWRNSSLCHVQSYIFAMDKPTLDYLIECEIFSITNYSPHFGDAIHKEILMSRKIIEKNWNIGSLLPYYKGVDFVQPQVTLLGDVMFPEYRNSLWSEYDLVFIKGNRVPIQKISISPEQLQQLDKLYP
jgi:hypothetical protein